MRRFLLLHSPLVGPASLAPLAEVWREAGHTVSLPDATGVAHQPRPAWMIDAVLAAVSGRPIDVVVAHSGAGALLPVVSSAVEARAMVFLDAVLPEPGASSWTLEPEMRAQLSEHVEPDGRLAPWLTWWDAHLVGAMLPDLDQRTAVAADCHRLPMSWYDHAVPLPDVWALAAFVALGSAYRTELARAADLGWPCRSLARSHLATVTHPTEVASAVREVLTDLGLEP